MGMPTSIEIVGNSLESIQKSYYRLEKINQKYSPYIPSSDLSKLWSNEKPMSSQSKEFINIHKECLMYEKITNGYFSAFFENRYNPTGYIKGWAIHEIEKIIKKDGHTNYCINFSGDMKFSSTGEKVWRVAIQSPFVKNKNIALLAMRNGAIATSGNYERGNHIINPKKPKLKSDLASVTVLGIDIIAVDVMATAIFAMGLKEAQRYLKLNSNYEALLIDENGNIYKTSDCFVLI